VSRSEVRAATLSWFNPLGAWTNPPDQLDKVWASFPTEIDFRQNNRIQGIPTHAQLVIFVVRQSETRISIGGQHDGWKYATYNLVLQVYCESTLPDPVEAMADIDLLIDAVHDRAVADHTFGQPSTTIFLAAEPDLAVTLGEPLQNDSGATQQWAQFTFDVTQFFQA